MLINPNLVKKKWISVSAVEELNSPRTALRNMSDFIYIKMRWWTVYMIDYWEFFLLILLPTDYHHPWLSFLLSVSPTGVQWCWFRLLMAPQTDTCHNGPLARYVKLWVTHAPGMPGTFSTPPQVGDPDMHHGNARAVMHAGIVNWRFPLKLVAGKTFPAFPAHAQPAIWRIW